jgi:hypothetical protein
VDAKGTTTKNRNSMGISILNASYIKGVNMKNGCEELMNSLKGVCPLEWGGD